MANRKPIYIQSLYDLKTYSLNCNWIVQWLFFPEGVIENLAQFDPQRPDIKIAHQIYLAFSLDNSFLCWLGQHLLSGLSEFIEQDFTQDVLDREELSFKIFQSCIEQDLELENKPLSPKSDHSNHSSDSDLDSDSDSSPASSIHSSLFSSSTSNTPKGPLRPPENAPLEPQRGSDSPISTIVSASPHLQFLSKPTIAIQQSPNVTPEMSASEKSKLNVTELVQRPKETECSCLCQ